jgi:hypothetical protein
MKEGVQEEVTLSSWIANSMHQNMDTVDTAKGRLNQVTVVATVVVRD